MSRGVRVRMWGDYALFSRPEMKVERCSYDVMTPSAARGMLEAVYWHPGMRWVVDKIYVRKPIQFTSIRRNEVKSKVLAGNVLSAINGGGKPLYISSREEIVQRAAILLRDVEYVVEAHFEMTPKATPGDNEGKFKDIIMRRLRRGESVITGRILAAGSSLPGLLSMKRRMWILHMRERKRIWGICCMILIIQIQRT